MNLLKTGALFVLLTACCLGAAAQTALPAKDNNFRKPELFHDLPQHITLNALSFNQLLQKDLGEKITLSLSSGFTFAGIVVSKSDAADVRSKTIVIKSTNRPGAALTITGINKSDGTVRYSGRMLSLKHSDAYELTEEDGRFALQKKALNDLVTE